MNAAPLSVFARPFLANPAMRPALDHPVLLWELAAGPARPDDAAWITRAGTPVPLPRAGEPVVLPVRKGSGKLNAFALGITVGRTDNNDVVLPHESVSRFQAYFQQDFRTGRWTLTDAGSTNGTFLEGQRLQGTKGTPLPDTATIKFGHVAVTYLSPGAFFRHIEAMAGSP